MSKLKKNPIQMSKHLQNQTCYFTSITRLNKLLFDDEYYARARCFFEQTNAGGEGEGGGVRKVRE